MPQVTYIVYQSVQRVNHEYKNKVYVVMNVVVNTHLPGMNKIFWKKYEGLKEQTETGRKIIYIQECGTFECSKYDGVIVHSHLLIWATNQ